MNGELKPNIGIALLFTTLTLFGANASAVTFNVSNADEFQAALTTAGSNGGDDEIVLGAGRYEGNFTYRAFETFDLSIVGELSAAREEVVLDGGKRAFVLRVLGPDQPFDLEIKNLTITGGHSEEFGGGLSLVNFREFESNNRFDVLESGHLSLQSLVVVDNFAPRAGGVFVSGWINIDLRDSYFVDNSVTPGGQGSHLLFEGSGKMTLEEIRSSDLQPYATIERNLFAETGETSLGGAFDGTVSVVMDLSVPSSTYLGQEEVYRGVQIQDNQFRRMGGNPDCLGAVEKEGCDYGGFTTSSFLNVQTGSSGLVFRENTTRDFVFPTGAYLSGFSIEVLENEFLSGASMAVEGRFVRMLNNTFDGLSLPANAVGQTFAGVSGLSGRGDRVTVQGNELRGGDITIVNDYLASQGEFNESIVSNNLVWKAKKCGLSVFTPERAEIHNNTIAGGEGSGICVSTSDKTDLLISNNISYFNSQGGSGLDIQRAGYGNLSTLRNNIFETASEIWDSDENNLNENPGFFDFDDGDLHVTSGSVAANSGSLEGITQIPELDLGGVPRVLEGVIDIGAYERSTTALHPADTNGDSSISIAEFEAYNAAWRNNEVWSVAPETIPVDFVTRAGYLLQKGGAYKNLGVGKPATWVPLNE